MPDGFAEHCRSLRLMYDDPSKSPPGETCALLGDAAAAGREIRGRVVFSGGGWCKPEKARGRGLASYLARLSRCYALGRFGTDWTVSTVRKSHIPGGLVRAYGYTRHHFEFRSRSPHSPGASAISADPLALVSMPREELLDDLDRFVAGLNRPSQAAE